MAKRWFRLLFLGSIFFGLLPSPTPAAPPEPSAPAPVLPPPPPPVEVVPSPGLVSTGTLPGVLGMPPSPHYTGIARPVTTTETAALVGVPSGYDVLSTSTLTRESLERLLPGKKTDVYLAVTLRDIIRFTLEENLDYRISEVNYEVAREETTAQWGLFDPLVTASVEETQARQQGSLFGSLLGGQQTGVNAARQAAGIPSNFEPLQSDVNRQSLPRSTDPQLQAMRDQLTSLTQGLSTGFAQDFRSINRARTRNATAQVTEQVPWGGTVGVGYGINRNWMKPSFLNINPVYSQSALVWVDHPLPFFRDWGRDVTMSGIRLAEKNQATRAWDKRQQLMQQIAASMAGYWDLVNAIYNAEVMRLSRDSAANLLKINEIRLKNEVGTEIDVWEARAGVAERESRLIVAAYAIGLAQDGLVRITRQKDGSDWKIRMIPRDTPHYNEYPVDEQKFLADAHARPDVQQAELMRQRAEIRRKVAKNQVMPQLNAFGQYGISGLGPTAGDAGHNMGTFDYHSWSLGLDFSVPIPNTKARARARAADKLVQGADLVIERSKDLAEYEVRNAIRALQSARESIDVTQARIRAEQEKLRGELRRYEVGMATSQDLLDYQDRLATAASSYINSIVIYNKAVIELERSRGTLLDSLASLGGLDVKIEPAPAPDPGN